jgi:ribose 5-phosphate isomerase A
MRPVRMSHEHEKQVAALASLRHVADGQVVGLGTGSTASYVIRALGERVRAGLAIRAIATSKRSHELAIEVGIPMVTFDEIAELDVTIDGADEIDDRLDLIKGAGGALLREKIVASASRRLVIVADSSKRVAVLGRAPLPVEVVAFAEAVVARRIAALGAKVALRRDARGDAVVTDEGHHLLDCSFHRIDDAAALARTLDGIPGVVEHGLFVRMADVAIVATGDQVLELPRPRRP